MKGVGSAKKKRKRRRRKEKRREDGQVTDVACEFVGGSHVVSRWGWRELTKRGKRHDETFFYLFKSHTTAKPRLGLTNGLYPHIVEGCLKGISLL